MLAVEKDLRLNIAPMTAMVLKYAILKNVSMSFQISKTVGSPGGKNDRGTEAFDVDDFPLPPTASPSPASPSQVLSPQMLPNVPNGRGPQQQKTVEIGQDATFFRGILGILGKMKSKDLKNSLRN